MATNKTCPECGSPIPNEADAELCPKCLLRAGIETGASMEHTRTVALKDGAIKCRAMPLLGETFGGYRIERLLGRGGMGAVYEAEHLESGRRVALKVLGHSLDSADARRRFFREGRLAASINHPNSVYVFGTEEIDGSPVISMELVRGGNLQELVRERGAMPVAKAVDAILQIIDGLEAAQSVGILHRDIKPANCFVDSDGTIKVGDFGLSIPTVGREESTLTVDGSFIGTPAFSSPEQIRGDELTVRSDIYAVGVTLYYLLTGKAPYAADNVVRLLALVLERPPESLEKWRSGLPRELCRIVLRCLEKNPDQRFKNYSDLRSALLPFASAAPTPATLAFRFLAGFIDLMLFMILGSMVAFIFVKDLDPFEFARMQSPSFLFLSMISNLVYLLYFGLLEGLRGASLGKSICRLRVEGVNRSSPGLGKAFLRAAVYSYVPVLPVWIYYAIIFSLGQTIRFNDWSTMAMSYSFYLVLASLFFTARRRNGFAAVHDLLTNTHVTLKSVYTKRPSLVYVEEPLPRTEGMPRIGPYYILETIAKTDAAELLLGYDTKLLRKVWIRRTPPGTPPIAPPLRHLGRIGRLRWLNGKRADGESWDAYEAVSGQPLLKLLDQPQPWQAVRFWLHDLLVELSVATQEQTLPAQLTPERVWIAADGRAKLLDWPVYGDEEKSEVQSEETPNYSPAEFIFRLANMALRESTNTIQDQHRRAALPNNPLPMHAHMWLDQVQPKADLKQLADRLKPLLSKLAVVTPQRRLGVILGCVSVPLLMVVSMLVSSVVFERWNAKQPEVWELRIRIDYLESLQRRLASEKNAKKIEALEIHIAGHYRDAITNDAAWSTLYAQSLMNERRLQRANELVAAHPNISQPELDSADERFKDKFAQISMGFSTEMFKKNPLLLPSVMGGLMFIYVGIPSLLAALLFRGGLILRILGLSVATSKGKAASRWRVFLRYVVSWSPLALLAFLPGWLGRGEDKMWLAILVMVGAAAIYIASALMRDRSLQDRLSRTRLVPR